MDQYIDKQIVVDMLNARADMATGTNANMLWGYAARMVELLPCADVASVVRCMDCEFYDDHFCFANQHAAHEDGFCDEGRKKSG